MILCGNVLVTARLLYFSIGDVDARSSEQLPVRATRNLECVTVWLFDGADGSAAWKPAGTLADDLLDGFWHHSSMDCPPMTLLISSRLTMGVCSSGSRVWNHAKVAMKNVLDGRTVRLFPDEKLPRRTPTSDSSASI